jgi:serine/threonine-protein kinase ATR
VIFDTVGSLLSLLRTGARDAYCQFFIDAMLAVEGKGKGKKESKKEKRLCVNECIDFIALLIFSFCVYTDILYVASFSVENRNVPESGRIMLKCFCKSFSGIFDDPACISGLPASSKPDDGAGVLINVTGTERWMTFATWMVKLLSKCVTEGTLYVEGLISLANVSAACSLLCFGNADLHMVSKGCSTSWRC